MGIRPVHKLSSKALLMVFQPLSMWSDAVTSAMLCWWYLFFPLSQSSNLLTFILTNNSFLQTSSAFQSVRSRHDFNLPSFLHLTTGNTHGPHVRKRANVKIKKKKDNNDDKSSSIMHYRTCYAMIVCKQFSESQQLLTVVNIVS